MYIVDGVGIQVTSGKVFYIDWEDYDEVIKYSWQASKSNGGYYITRMTSGANNLKRNLIFLHNQLMSHESNKETQVDHINGNSLNNRRSNLEIVTHVENNRRRSLRKYGIRVDALGNELPQGICYLPNRDRYVVYYKNKSGGWCKTLDIAIKTLDRVEKKDKIRVSMKLEMQKEIEEGTFISQFNF